MSDLTELFKRVAPDVDTQPSVTTVEADLARGRSALVRDHRKRTIRRSMMTATAFAAAGVIAVVASQLGSGTSPHHQAGHQPPAKVGPATHHGQKPNAQKAPNTKSVKLVAYAGKQLHGFTVDKIPSGWFLSTSTQYALLIDPNGSTDNDPDAFVGKLAVLTQSKDVHSLPPGTPVTVNGQAGVVTDQGKYGESLTYNNASGFGVVIQAPAALNWSDSQIVAFAEGVHMTSDALQGSG
jgi:hypothetical protein